MKKLGLLGGTSWHSTIEYYKFINQYVNTHFGDNTNPPLLVYTVNQALIHKYQIENNWEGVAQILTEAAQSLEKAGAEMVMFCANTPHKVYENVTKEINIPVLHIADTTADEIKSRGLKKVCFLGTKYTMTEEFVTKRIADNGIEVITPEKDATIEKLHNIIQKELTYGNITSESKKYVIEVIQSMINRGAEGVVLGCTEFPLMIKEGDLQIPIFDTTEIHAKAGADYILKG